MMTSRLRIVAINDVYELTNLPKLQTFLSRLSPSPSAITLAGDFLSPSALSSIDGGRGMVATLRATGITHFILGNHEADLPLHTVQERFQKLTKSASFINTNLRNPPPSASWMTSPQSLEYDIIRTSDDRVKVALLGLLSDEADVFFDGTFKGVPVSNVLDTFSNVYNKVIPSVADFVVPLTHQSLARDKDLAQHMLDMNIGKGVIIGGHDHIVMDETVSNSNGDSIQILKSGSDAVHASVVDLLFDTSISPPSLTSIETTLVDLREYEDSAVVKAIADQHLSILETVKDETLVQADKMIPPGQVLSSERTRFEQTTVGSFFCQAIKEELEVDSAVINGGTIKGGATYPDNTISYAQLKKELPFPTKMVVVPMSRAELQDAIYYSRDNVEDDARMNSEGEVERRGYLQVDLDMDLVPHAGDHDDILKVALPRNLLAGFCKIKPLMDVGARLKEEGLFPGEDDFIPALNLIVRYCSKTRWFDIVHESFTFEDLDLNKDGVLDRHEVKKMMERFLGHEPADIVVDHMIESIDKDGNGVIDVGELSYLIATMEREEQWRKF